MDLEQYTLDSLARKALSIYLESGEHPNNIVIEIASNNNLNPEQTRRLCEATNVTIKKHKTYEENDPQAEFPLADWKVVCSNVSSEDHEDILDDILADEEKMASLLGEDAWDIVEQTNPSGCSLEKKAGSAGPSVADLSSAIEMLKHAKQDASGFRVSAETSKAAAVRNLLSTLREDAIKEQSINRAYTIALEKIGSISKERHDAVEYFFDSAHGFLSSDLNIKMAELGLVPVHGTINPSWSFLKDLSHYIGEKASARKLAHVEKEIQHQIDDLTRAVGRRIAIKDRGSDEVG